MSLEPIARDICNQRNFQFVRHLGEGSFKETFLIVDSCGQQQALKILKAGLTADRIRRELDAMVTCHHSNIARLFAFDIATVNGQAHAYMVEEYLAGGSMTQRLGRMPPLTRNDIIALGHSLAGAVQHIASKDLVHRDIKPDNVMFRVDGVTPVVVDFGIVRALNRTSLTQDWLARGPGTALYAPFEQLNNRKELINWRADQFSLGVTLVVAAFNMHPYQRSGDSQVAIVDRVSNGEELSPEFKAATKSWGLEILERMVAPWPVQRFRRPEDLIDAWARVT